MEDGLLAAESKAAGERLSLGYVADVKMEAKKMGYIAAPMVAVMLSQFLVQVISTMMVGHLGELQLAGSSIATSLSNVTGLSFLLGLASGLETLCGQAYGAQQYRKLGIDMYRAIFTLLVVCVPISIAWLYMGQILVFLGQKPNIAVEAGNYIVWMIPALYAYAIMQPLMKFLQAQSLIFPMLLSFFLTLLLHIPLCWFLVFKTAMGVAGAALSISMIYWANVIVLGLYVKFSDSCKETRVPISKDALRGIYEFLRLALPSAVMICLEWWSFEFLVLLSGLLPNPELETSVLSICLNTISALYCIPYGIGAAASTRVSNELGAGNSHGARVAVRTSMLIAVTEAVIVSSTILLLRNVLGYAFSNENEVVAYVRKMAPFISLSVIMDTLQGVQAGVARGCGWQHLGAYINIGAYYLIGVPIALLLGFWLNLRGQGLWIGILSGITVQNICLALVTYFTNWQQQVDDARERITRDKSLEDELLK